MAYFNTTTLANTSTFPGLVQYADKITGGLFSAMFAIAFFIIMFVAFSQYDKTTAILIASALTFMLTVLMWAAGLCGWLLTTITFVITIVFFAIAFLQR